MTIRDYISQKFQSLGITEADFADFTLNLDDDYTYEREAEVGKAICSFLEGVILMPRRTNLSESGFSESWNYDTMGKYYLWMCKKYGVTPNSDLTSLLGMSMIKDCTGRW